MELGHYVTLVGTAIAAASPYFLTFVPPPYAPLISGAVAGASALWHLWMASPWSK